MLKSWKALWKKSLSKLVLLALCLALCISWAAAAGATGSISVCLTDDNDRPVSGVSTVLYRVAEPDGTLTAQFSGSAVDPAVLASGLDNAKNAQILADLAKALSLTGSVKTTGSTGWVKYGNLTEGIYLVICRPGQTVTFAPYLVYLPTVINGMADYDVESYPKAEDVVPPAPGPSPDPEPTDSPDPEPTDSPEPVIYRVTYSYYGDVPENAPELPAEEWYEAGETVTVHPAPVIDGYTFKWTYDPAELPAANLASLAAQQVRSSVGMARLSSSLLTSPMDGREDLTAESFVMPANDVHLIGVFTAASGTDPEPSESPDPEPTGSAEPDQPDLPQTGVNVWPVYLLLGIGSLLVIAGLVDLCVTRRKQDE